MRDLAAWLLLLMCAALRSNYLLRALPPGVTGEFARGHDAAVIACLGRLLGNDQPLTLDPLSLRHCRCDGRSFLSDWAGLDSGPPRQVEWRRTGRLGPTCSPFCAQGIPGPRPKHCDRPSSWRKAVRWRHLAWRLLLTPRSRYTHGFVVPAWEALLCGQPPPPEPETTTQAWTGQPARAF